MSGSNTMKGSQLQELLSNLSDGTLNKLLELGHQEQRQRLMDSLDEDYLLDLALKRGFDGAGNPLDPFEVAPGIVALTATVKDTSSTRHSCTHYTVRPDASQPEEYWSFEDSPTLIKSDTNKVDKVRVSVSLHAIPSGGAVLRHTMTHDGERHTRKGSRAWKVDLDFDNETGEPSVTFMVTSELKATKLPTPDDR